VTDRLTCIPELAGISTYADAARIGFSVDENVRRLLRLHWAERQVMRTLVAHITSTPEWEVKCAMCLHQWHCAEHAEMLRRRIVEMRHPAPNLDAPPDAELDAFLGELLRSENTLELLVGIYDVALPGIRDAYRAHIAHTNQLVDHPTRRLMRLILVDVEEAIEWGQRALAAFANGDETADVGENGRRWRAHLQEYLRAAGGIAGEDELLSRGADSLPAPRAAEPFTPDFQPARDERFSGLYNFNFPPHLVYNAEGVPPDERNLALLCKRALEMDVPEMMASFMTERKEQPWEFYYDYSRQLWDEARHAMLGTVALQSRGLDWTSIPLNISFALRLNKHATPLERQILLYAIEQSLMPGDTGKRFEHATAVEAGDMLSAHFHDYDWADEVLHAQIGRRALAREGISQKEAIERAKEIHDRTWATLPRYAAREAQVDWWPAFVQLALGKDSAVRTDDLGEIRMFSE
jgi:bacterioferritin (cytochrome b1)